MWAADPVCCTLCEHGANLTVVLESGPVTVGDVPEHHWIPTLGAALHSGRAGAQGSHRTREELTLMQLTAC